MSAEYNAENDRARHRLANVTEKLTVKELALAIDQDWTISTKLAHLAFWDLYYLALVKEWEASGFRVAPTNVDAINESTLILSRAIPSVDIVQMVRDAAEAIDSKIASLPPHLASTIEQGGYPRILRRYMHRREHLNEIERTLRATETPLQTTEQTT